MLLQTLSRLRYLEYDREARKYFPTVRVSLLGSWITENLYSERSLSKLVDDLHARTTATVILGLQSDVYVQYIHVRQTPERRAQLRWYLKPGSLRPIARTAVGRTLLASKPDSEVIYLIRRINALEKRPENRVSEADILEEMDRIRETGHAMTQGTLNPQAGVVACMLPPHPQQPAMALGIGTMNEELVERKAEFLALIEKSLEAFQHGGQIAAPDDEPA
jgi:DNA-binding IclR family transcriptional regulator